MPLSSSYRIIKRQRDESLGAHYIVLRGRTPVMTPGEQILRTCDTIPDALAIIAEDIELTQHPAYICEIIIGRRMS